MGMKYAEDPFNMGVSFDTPIKRLDKLYIKDGLKSGVSNCVVTDVSKPWEN